MHLWSNFHEDRISSYPLVRCHIIEHWQKSAISRGFPNLTLFVQRFISGKIFIQIRSVIILLGVDGDLCSMNDFQNLMDCFLYLAWPLQKISPKSVNFLSCPANRQTNTSRNIYLLVELSNYNINKKKGYLLISSLCEIQTCSLHIATLRHSLVPTSQERCWRTHATQKKVTLTSPSPLLGVLVTELNTDATAFIWNLVKMTYPFRVDTSMMGLQPQRLLNYECCRWL